MNAKPIISVLMLTYNHIDYIDQAIGSVLMQKGVQFELCIGDHSSTDGTSAVCDRYAKANPSIVKHILCERNPATLNCKAVYMQNLINAYGRCTGEYVATLDGDDYWVDEYKLAKQLAALEGDNTLSIAFSRFARIGCVGKDGAVIGTVARGSHQRVTIESVFYGKISLASCTMLFRRNCVPEIWPKLCNDVHFADFFIKIACLRTGDGIVIDDIAAAYRVHQNGVWSGKTESDACKDLLEDVRLAEKEGWLRGRVGLGVLLKFKLGRWVRWKMIEVMPSVYYWLRQTRRGWFRVFFR